jgi:hypothetical protein
MQPFVNYIREVLIVIPIESAYRSLTGLSLFRYLLPDKLSYMSTIDPTGNGETIDDLINEDDAPATSLAADFDEGGIVPRNRTAGENSEAEVGDPGHWGVDEGTE